ASDSTGTGVAHASVQAPTGSFRPSGPMHGHKFRVSATLLGPGKVLIASGGFGTGDDVELYDPQSNAFAPVGTTPVGEYHAAAPLLDGSALLVGGQSLGGPAEALWTGQGFVRPAGLMHEARFDETATL